MPAEAASAAPAREGELLAGKYVLVRKLGAGGMGEVWLARNVALGREVAIKLLQAERAQDRDFVARFLREARTANLVRHPNVVDVLDVGQGDTGAPFLVQELLDGEDLAACVKRNGGRLAVGDAMTILLPVLEALAFAHAKGVVHRDIKPENVFLANEGGAVVPKLLDFGISHVATGGARMTATGVALGTPAYMSPEQIKGQVDARTDVWAFGVMIHECLSGALPFTSETREDLFVQIATADPIPLEEAAPGAPKSIARIVAKCLRRARDDRYADAGRLLAELRAVASGGGVESSHERIVSPLASSKALAITELQSRGGMRRGGIRELEAEPVASPALQVETMRPPPGRARRFRSLRPASDDADALRWVATLLVTLGALVAGGLLAFVNPWPDGLVLGPMASQLLAEAPPLAARVIAAAIAAAAIVVAVRGWRLEPKSLGHFLAAAGLVATAAVVMASTTGQGSERALPWAAALAVGGVAAMSLRHARDAWIEEQWASVAVMVVVATVALFAGVQLVRGP